MWLGLAHSSWIFVCMPYFANACYKLRGSQKPEAKEPLTFHRLYEHYHPKIAVPWWTRTEDIWEQYKALYPDTTRQYLCSQKKSMGTNTAHRPEAPCTLTTEHVDLPLLSGPLWGENRRSTDSLTEDTFLTSQLQID